MAISQKTFGKTGLMAKLENWPLQKQTSKHDEDASNLFFDHPLDD
jgi:hypothetical protein